MSKVHSFVFNIKDFSSASGKESHAMHSRKQEEINWKILQFSWKIQVSLQTLTNLYDSITSLV